MPGEKSMVVMAVVATVASVLSIVMVYFYLQTFLGISGHVSSIGEVNLTVESQAAINFTTDSINWGSGRVNNGANAAHLTTSETNNVTNGNWTLQTRGGLRLQNDGNSNVTLNLSVTKTAATFIGGTNPMYKWNITNYEASSCLNSTGGSDLETFNLTHFYNPNTTTTLVCSRFQFADTSDMIRIDINLTIPSDSLTGTLNDVITAVAFPA